MQPSLSSRALTVALAPQSQMALISVMVSATSNSLRLPSNSLHWKSVRRPKHRLRQKGESPENARQAVEWLDGLSLLDDEAAARQIVRSGTAKGYGAARIRQMLYAKHIPRELWDEALAELPEQDDAIDAFLQKRFRGRQPDRTEIRRAADALLRRGHAWGDIRRALERYDPDFPEE